MLHQLLHDMFSIEIPVIEKILRPVIVYIFLVLLLRIFGKRELAQLNPFDLVVLLSLSNTVQNAIIGNDNSVGGGMIGAFSLVFINYIVVRFLFRHRRLEQLLEGKPSVLVRDGRICKDELLRELITPAELQSVARRQGFEGLHEVEECVLQPGGAFVMRRKCPSTEDLRHEELLARMAALTAQLERMEGRLPAAS